MILSEFDIEYIDRKSIKGKVIVDQLEDPRMEDHQPLVSKFLDEIILPIDWSSCWTLYFNGSHTQHVSRASILFLTPQGDSIPKAYKISFPCTNNISEYEVLIIGLKMAIEWRIKEL